MKNSNLTEGKLVPSLLKFTFPILLSLLLQIAYGTVDLIVVSKYGSVADISGVTIGSQVMKTVIALCSGLAMGTTILLGSYIGSGQREKTSKVVGTSIAIFGAIATAFSLFLMFGDGLISSLMNTPADSFDMACAYLFYSGVGATFLVFYNLIGSIFRGIGDSKTPLMAVSIACVINIVLDILFVKHWNMGAGGASIATTIAQASSVILSLFMLRKRELPFTISRDVINFDKEYSRDIINLGAPVAIQGTLVNFSFLFITSVINPLGLAASAAVGVVEKITGMIMLVPQAFNQSLSAFTAQNFGAGRADRSNQALKYAITFSLIFGCTTAYLSAFHGTIFTDIFIKNEPETTHHALLYLQSYAIDTLIVSVLFCMTGYFNGYGKTKFVMLQSLMGAFIMRIPIAYFFGNLENTNLFIIGMATPITTFCQMFLCFWFYSYCKKEQLLYATQKKNLE